MKNFSFTLLFLSSVGAFLLLSYGLIFLQVAEILALDNALNIFANALHSDLLNQFFISVTQSFDPPIFLSWFLILLVLLWFRNKRFAVVFLFFGVGGGQAVKMILKYLIDRDRPENPFELAAHASSFPSGHATTAVFFFLAIGYLFSQKLSRGWRMALQSLCIAGVILVPLSRVYVQVHYFSDVIAGSLLGIASFAFTAFVFSFFKK